jgi:hypothetical protein
MAQPLFPSNVGASRQRWPFARTCRDADLRFAAAASTALLVAVAVTHSFLPARQVTPSSVASSLFHLALQAVDAGATRDLVGEHVSGSDLFLQQQQLDLFSLLFPMPVIWFRQRVCFLVGSPCFDFGSVAQSKFIFVPASTCFYSILSSSGTVT